MAAQPQLNPLGQAGGARLASRVLPMCDGEACGDAAGHFAGPVSEGDETPRRLLAIIDGLGHGLEAAKAAQAAMDTLHMRAADPALPLDELLNRLDARLTPTRGAAIGLVRLDGLQLQHAGIGNTRTLHLRGGLIARLPSQNGIVGGGQALRVAVNTLTLQAGDGLLMFTDGLDERLQLPLVLPEWRRDPDTLCQHLLARWRQGRDDAGVLAFFLDLP